jgi:2-methylcitrate dehydratase PrpD
MSPPATLIEFVHQLRFEDVPAPVVAHARRCVLDLLGVAAGGSQTQLSSIIRRHAVHHFAHGGQGAGARMLFDGRPVSTAGAALSGGMAIDSLDAHDGHVLTKGHAGVAVLPAVLAFADALQAMDGREFLVQIVIGYEIATRAGIALHATACDYHTSGAWNTIACAAIGARNLKLGAQETQHALGIAEYHGPRSQMMRCIDHPTMVKDGSGWGAMAGVSAAYLAADGFTGAPAITTTSDAVEPIWADLGQRWLILDQYFKPHPVCRWAQPAIEAAWSLSQAHQLRPEQIATVEVWTFHEACRLATRLPSTTEQAQYSLPYPVAAILRHGSLGAAEVSTQALLDPQTRRLAAGMALHEEPRYNQLFPAERWAHVHVTLQDGTRLESAPSIARGNPENALSASEIHEKFMTLSSPVIGPNAAAKVASAVHALGSAESSFAEFLSLILEAPHPSNRPAKD